MKKRLISLCLAVLLTGCAAKHTDHTVKMDDLSFTLPYTFTDMSGDSTENPNQAFMYAQDNLYITGFQESKAELSKYFQYISLGAYVQMFCENYFPDIPAQHTDDIWNIVYTTAIDGKDYTFLCLFYETQESFWRVQACCPSEDFAENQQVMWDYLSSAD